MRHLFLLVPSIVTVAALGCSTAGVTPNVVTSGNASMTGPTARGGQLRYIPDANSLSYELPVAPSVLWPKLGVAYSALSIPITTSDTVDHIFGATRASVSAHLGKRPISYALDCGQSAYGAPLANSYRVSLTALTRVTASAEGSKVTTTVSGFAQDPNVSSSSVQCASTGALESDIQHALTAP